jgi:hypothetical protein
MGAFPTGSLANRKQGISCLFPRSTSVLLNLIRIRRHDKNLQVLSGSFSIFAVFFCFYSTTFGQTQTCAPIPLKPVEFELENVSGWKLRQISKIRVFIEVQRKNLDSKGYYSISQRMSTIFINLISPYFVIKSWHFLHHFGNNVE